MFQPGMVITVSLCAIFLGVFPVCGQNFPYSAPQAPEFDDNGNIAPSAPQRVEPEPERRPAREPDRNSAANYREVRPYVPQDQPAPQPAPKPKRQSQNYSGPPGPAASAPGQRGGQPVGGPPPPRQERPDCGQFPMLIAGAKSDAEMQWTARQFLTCLLQTGWQMEQAKQHVITVIESAYRLNR